MIARSRAHYFQKLVLTFILLVWRAPLRLTAEVGCELLTLFERVLAWGPTHKIKPASALRRLWQQGKKKMELIRFCHRLVHEHLPMHLIFNLSLSHWTGFSSPWFANYRINNSAEYWSFCYVTNYVGDLSHSLQVQPSYALDLWAKFSWAAKQTEQLS